MSLITAIEGVLEAKGADSATVRVGGVSFNVSVPVIDLGAIGYVGEVARLCTHLVVREDDLQLYGFASEQGRKLFESLVAINGVGPKAALAVLSVLSPADLASAIVSGDATSISRAQGVGKRTADRIILELRGKLEEELGPIQVGAVPTSAGADPALAWLQGLGFSALESRQALSVEPEEGLAVEERVRRALQRMGEPQR